MGKSADERAVAGLSPGLYLVATPIGSARDMTLRALDILAAADVIAAEDTRTARKLMELHGVSVAGRPLVAYHDHNGPAARPKLLQALGGGQSVAYVSEAGTPLVADPGYQLVQAAIAQGDAVFAAPGASAILAALCVAGLPSDRFIFAGFPPARGEKQRRWLKEQAQCDATLVLYESAKRVHRLLVELAPIFSDETQMALCRELTKRHEEVIRGSISEVAGVIANRTLKGEIVLVIGPRRRDQPDRENLEDALREALEKMGLKQAASDVAELFGMPRREVYQLALAMKSRGASERE
ncbi:MAG: 16S rRNA (cytidine(1402)-2'-O)-methyltransferase [Pseudomonadota bacterium]